MAKAHRPINHDVSVRARLPSDLKEAGDAVLRQEGLSQSQAVRLIWQAMVRRGRFPHELLVPNEETQAALREPRGQGKQYANAREMHSDTLSDGD